MGIKDFYKVFADSLVTIPGIPKDKRLAVDSAGEIWRAGVVTQHDLLEYDRIIYMICRQMKQGSIWVFDRMNIHKQNEHEIRQERRRVALERRENLLDEFEEMTVQLNNVSLDIVETLHNEEVRDFHLTADEYIEPHEIKETEIAIMENMFSEDIAIPDNGVTVEQGIQDKIIALEKQTFKPQSYHFERAKRIIEECKHIIITAPPNIEAEAYCAYLNLTGQVDYVFTIDSDVFAFGALNVIRRTQKREFQQMNFNDILRQMPEGYRKYSDFVDLCVSLGCDFCPRIRGVGAKTCMKVTKSRNSLPLWVFSKSKWTEEHYKAKEIFEERNAYFE
jgi:5'-3' exonuclease